MPELSWPAMTQWKRIKEIENGYSAPPKEKADHYSELALEMYAWILFYPVDI